MFSDANNSPRCGLSAKVEASFKERDRIKANCACVYEPLRLAVNSRFCMCPQHGLTLHGKREVNLYLVRELCERVLCVGPNEQRSCSYVRLARSGRDTGSLDDCRKSSNVRPQTQPAGASTFVEGENSRPAGCGARAYIKLLLEGVSSKGGFALVFISPFGKTKF